MEVSVIVRYHNEEKYLGAVMEALSQQEFPFGEYEIIAIDNLSDDNSTEIVAKYTKKILPINDYQPGKALNMAIAQVKGKYIAALSAHTIPASRNWLATLYKHMNSPDLAGVYGSQLYHIDSKFLDKRDLDIFFRDKPRVETEDSDFWNANSMFPRTVWEKQPFDEKVYELEDHHWTKMLLPKGYKVHFEPNALVYHYDHVLRNDREYLAKTNITEEELIEGAIAILEKKEADWPDTMVAGLTIASLTHSKHIYKAVNVLGKVLLNHWDFDVRWRVAGALGKINCKESVYPLVEALSDASFYSRDEAAWSLARLGRIAVEPILEHIENLNSDCIPFAALALGKSGDEIGEKRAVDLLIDEIETGNKERIRNAIYFAGEIIDAENSTELIPNIEKFLHDNDNWLVAVCCWALGCFAKRKNINWQDIQTIAIEHKDEFVRYEATVALGKVARFTDNKDVIAILSSKIEDTSNIVRFGAAQSLRTLIEKKGIDVKIEHKDNDFGVQYELNLIKKYGK